MEDPEIITPIWNSLEIVKITIAATTPILVAFLLFYFNRVFKRYERAQWTNQKITEKRIEIYDTVAPKLNDLFCFFCFIGNWKEISPKRIIELKRWLDKKIYIYSPLFSQKFLVKYNDFTKQCFSTFSGWGKDAKIISTFNRRKQFGKDDWEEEWEELFDKDYIEHSDDSKIKKDVELINEKYDDFMKEFVKYLEICQSGIFHKSGTPNINF